MPSSWPANSIPVSCRRKPLAAGRSGSDARRSRSRPFLPPLSWMWISAASPSISPNRTPPSASGGIKDDTMSYEMLLNEQDVSLDIVARRPDLQDQEAAMSHFIPSRRVPSHRRRVRNRRSTARPISGWRYVHRRRGLSSASARAPSSSACRKPSCAPIRKAQGRHDALHADMPGTVIALHAEGGDRK